MVLFWFVRPLFRICLVWQAHWFAERLTSERAQREPGAFKQSWRTLSHTESKTDSSTHIYKQLHQHTDKDAKEAKSLGVQTVSCWHFPTQSLRQTHWNKYKHTDTDTDKYVRQQTKNYQRCQGSTQQAKIVRHKHTKT